MGDAVVLAVVVPWGGGGVGWSGGLILYGGDVLGGGADLFTNLGCLSLDPGMRAAVQRPQL